MSDLTGGSAGEPLAPLRSGASWFWFAAAAAAAADDADVCTSWFVGDTIIASDGDSVWIGRGGDNGVIVGVGVTVAPACRFIGNDEPLWRGSSSAGCCCCCCCDGGGRCCCCGGGA